MSRFRNSFFPVGAWMKGGGGVFLVKKIFLRSNGSDYLLTLKCLLFALLYRTLQWNAENIHTNHQIKIQKRIFGKSYQLKLGAGADDDNLIVEEKMGLMYWIYSNIELIGWIILIMMMMMTMMVVMMMMVTIIVWRCTILSTMGVIWSIVGGGGAHAIPQLSLISADIKNGDMEWIIILYAVSSCQPMVSINHIHCLPFCKNVSLGSLSWKKRDDGYKGMWRIERRKERGLTLIFNFEICHSHNPNQNLFSQLMASL